MKKVLFLSNYGFSLVEVLLAVSVFSFLVIALVGSLIYGQQATVLAGERTRAILLANEGLEATRNVRDENILSLTDGDHGLVISNNKWKLYGSEDVTDDFYTRNITISTIDDDRKEITSTVTWQQNLQRQGTVTLVTYLTNWKPASSSSALCAAYCEDLTYTTGTCRQSAGKCTANGETHESGGDTYCTAPGENTCCCAP